MVAKISGHHPFVILLVISVAVVEIMGGEFGIVLSDIEHALQTHNGNNTIKIGHVPISTGQEKISCSHYDGNACICALAGCQIDANACVPYQNNCNVREFDRDECARAHTFYSLGGVYCENTIQAGDCERDLTAKSNFAVNLNGNDHTDANNVRYISQNTTNLSTNLPQLRFQNASDYGTSVCKLKGRGNIVEVENHKLGDLSDKKDIPSLLWGYVEGSRTKSPGMYHTNATCLEFTTVLLEEGNFELVFKVVEMEYLHSARRFDVKVNDLRIFPNIDVFRLASKECYAIDLTINFMVRLNKTREILFKGFPALPLHEDGQMRIQLCESECSSIPNIPWDFNFIASAFAVTKLKGGPGC